MQRFISQDPIGFASGDFNWYRYVGDSPVNKIDPKGLCVSKSAPAWQKKAFGVCSPNYGTNSCAYYKQRCSETGDYYYCKIAPIVCNMFPKEPGGMSNCIRKCLQDYDEEVCDKCDSEGGRSICAVPAHINCFIMCPINPR